MRGGDWLHTYPMNSPYDPYVRVQTTDKRRLHTCAARHSVKRDTRNRARVRGDGGRARVSFAFGCVENPLTRFLRVEKLRGPYAMLVDKAAPYINPSRKHNNTAVPHCSQHKSADNLSCLYPTLSPARLTLFSTCYLIPKNLC